MIDNSNSWPILDQRGAMKHRGRITALLAAAVLADWPVTRLHAAAFTSDNDHVSVSRSVSSPAPQFPGPAPGEAKTAVAADSLSIGNRALSASWRLGGGRFNSVEVRSGLEARTLSLGGEPFQIFLADGTRYAASGMKVDGKPLAIGLQANGASARLADRLRGRKLQLRLRSADGRLRVLWRAILHDGANYLRQEIEVAPLADDLAIGQIVWFDQPLPGASSAGGVDGSPVVAGGFFLGFEDPMSVNMAGAEPDPKFAPAARLDSSGKVEGNRSEPRVVCRLERNAVLKRDETLTLSFVVGVAPPGQMRRAFPRHGFCGRGGRRAETSKQ